MSILEKLPKFDEERDILERARASKQGMAELIERYGVLVRINANKFKVKDRINDSWKHDLYQEGYIALMKAANTYDESYGSKFTTWAHACIEGAIRNMIRTIRGRHFEYSSAVSLNSMLNEEMTIEGLFASESIEPDFRQSLSDQSMNLDIARVVSKRELDLIRIRYNLEV